MNRIATVMGLAALLVSGFAAAPAQAAGTTTKQVKTCSHCAAPTGKTSAVKAHPRLAASETASCCTSGICCPECPTCCQSGTCNTGKCPQGCCSTTTCQPGAACCH